MERLKRIWLALIFSVLSVVQPFNFAAHAKLQTGTEVRLYGVLCASPQDGHASDSSSTIPDYIVLQPAAPPSQDTETDCYACVLNPAYGLPLQPEAAPAIRSARQPDAPGQPAQGLAREVQFNQLGARAPPNTSV